MTRWAAFEVRGPQKTSASGPKGPVQPLSGDVVLETGVGDTMRECIKRLKQRPDQLKCVPSLGLCRPPDRRRTERSSTCSPGAGPRLSSLSFSTPLLVAVPRRPTFRDRSSCTPTTRCATSATCSPGSTRPWPASGNFLRCVGLSLSVTAGPERYTVSL
jgi:hypothetical protein